MIQDLEADFTGARIYASNTGDADLAEVANSGESVTVEAKAINEMEIDVK